MRKRKPVEMDVELFRAAAARSKYVKIEEKDGQGIRIEIDKRADQVGRVAARHMPRQPITTTTRTCTEDHKSKCFRVRKRVTPTPAGWNSGSLRFVEGAVTVGTDLHRYEERAMSKGLVVEYDRGACANDDRGRRLIPMFGCGMLAAFALIMVWCGLATWRSHGAAVVLNLLMVEPAPAIAAMAALSLTLSLETRKGRGTFRTSRAAAVWGAIAGTGAICLDLWGTLIWHVAVASVAAAFLVRRAETEHAVGLRLWFWHRFKVWGAGLLLFVGAGTLSAFVSCRACEEKTVRHVATDIMRGAPFRETAGESEAERRVFSDVGILRLPAGTGPDAYPCASARQVKVFMLFIASSKYGWHFGSLYGEGRQRTYLCLFGTVFVISDELTWIS